MLDKSNFHPRIAVADKVVKPLVGIYTFIQTCNFHLKSKCLENNSRILKDLIGTWQLMSHGERHNIELILSQNLWNNTFIMRNDHSIVYTDLLSKGKKRVLDLDNSVGLLESWKSISQKFGLENSNFISWYSTVQCFSRNRRNSYEIRANFWRIISVTFDMAFLFQVSSPNYLKSGPIQFMIVLSEKTLSPQRLRRHFPKSLKLVKNCAPKFTCCQVNV